GRPSRSTSRKDHANGSRSDKTRIVSFIERLFFALESRWQAKGMRLLVGGTRSNRFWYKRTSNGIQNSHPTLPVEKVQPQLTYRITGGPGGPRRVRVRTSTGHDQATSARAAA